MKYGTISKIKKPYIKCIDNVIVDVNHEFACLTGFTREELLQKTLEQAGMILRTFDQVDLALLRGEMDVYMFNKQYEPMRTTISVNVVFDTNGGEREKRLYFEARSNIRIIERFNFAEQFYTDKNTRVSLTTHPDQILLMANDNYFENDAGFSIHAMREYNMGRKQIFTMFKSFSNREFFDNIANHNKAFHVEEYEVTNEKGSTFWNMSIVPMSVDGKVEYFVQTKVDVTEKVMARRRVEKQAIVEAKLREMRYVKSQYDMLYKIIENLDLPVMRLSYPELCVKDLNQRVLDRIISRRWTSASINDLRKKKLEEVLSKELCGDIVKHITKLVQSGGNSYVSNMMRMVENEQQHSKFIYQPVRGLNNEIVEIALIAIDVTQEVNARNQIEHSMKLQEELFSNISHELKTPLNVIFSMAQLFDFYDRNDLMELNREKITDGIRTMKQNCYRLTRLISNIVDMSKLESGFMKLNLSNENIVYVIEDIVQSVAGYVKDKGMNIIFDTDVEEKIIACDPDKIERILLNLISNAIKFSEAGSEIQVNMEDRGDKVFISVSDNGIGMDPGKLDRIFDRYHQIDKSFARNVEGSGIGLSLVKSIVELHGGSISVESRPGEGSIFRILLPAVKSSGETLCKPFDEEEKMRKIGMINVEFSDIYDLTVDQ